MIQKTSSLPMPRPLFFPRESLALPIMLTAVAALSLAAIFIRLSEQELGPFGTLFNRFWIAFVALWIWKQINSYLTSASPEKMAEPESETYSPQNLFWILVSGVLFWGCLALWAFSLLDAGVANSTILHNLTPIFTTLGAWVLFRQHFDSRFLLGLALAIVGAVSLGAGDLNLSAEAAVGDGLALLSAVFLAGNLMVVERLRAKFSAITIILWHCGVGAALTLPVVYFCEDHLFPISGFGWFSVIGLALVCQVLGQGLQAYSLKRLSSGLVGVLLLLDPVLAALIAAVVFLEHLSLPNWISFATVLVGIYIAKSSRCLCEECEESTQDTEPSPAEV